jgi:oligoendopeptidase F
LKLEESIALELGKIFVYAHMKSHEDLRIAKYQEYAARADTLNALYAESIAFYAPEILKIPAKKLRAFLDDERLKLYAFHFEELLHSKSHTLSPEQEEILARASEIARTADNTFTMFTDADMKFPTITDENGEKIELTEERYYKLNRSKNRRVRKAAFEGLFSTYSKYRNTFGALFQGSVRGDIFYSKNRKYPSCLEASLHADNVPLYVYENVINCANEHAHVLHDYMRLRKRVLKLKELHMYDLNVPLVEEPEIEISYEEAVEIVLDGLKPLGDEYCKVLRHGINEKWIDVYENEGKRKGAYSWGSYGTSPYILLNYNGTLRDVFTLAHEMGHSLHSFWTHKTQPQVYGDYTIFLAEVASTTNEMLLIRHLLKKRPKERKWLLNYGLDMVRTTLYRQAMFAEFERDTHAMAENGEILTHESLCELWRRLNSKYYGPDMVIDGLIEMEWARIPHFYSAFYVYKYVTGFVSACSLSQKIIESGRPMSESYLDFLSKGGSNWPLDILKSAGVDFSSSAPFTDAINMFKGWLLEW